MEETMTKKYADVNEGDVKKILEVFLGKGAASQVSINDKVIELTWDMLASSKECSKAMNFEPRPQGLAATPAYIAKELAGIAYRLSSNKDAIYHVCKVAAEAGYSSRIKLAGMGL